MKSLRQYVLNNTESFFLSFFFFQFPFDITLCLLKSVENIKWPWFSYPSLNSVSLNSTMNGHGSVSKFGSSKLAGPDSPSLAFQLKDP